MLVFFEQTLASAIVSILLFHRTLNGLLKLQVSYQSFLGYSAVIDLIGEEFEGLKLTGKEWQ